MCAERALLRFADEDDEVPTGSQGQKAATAPAGISAVQSSSSLSSNRLSSGLANGASELMVANNFIGINISCYDLSPQHVVVPLLCGWSCLMIELIKRNSEGSERN